MYFNYTHAHASADKQPFYVSKRDSPWLLVGWLQSCSYTDKGFAFHFKEPPDSVNFPEVHLEY